jgi:hypothetical protein
VIGPRLNQQVRAVAREPADGSHAGLSRDLHVVDAVADKDGAGLQITDG